MSLFHDLFWLIIILSSANSLKKFDIQYQTSKLFVHDFELPHLATAIDSFFFLKRKWRSFPFIRMTHLLPEKRVVKNETKRMLPSVPLDTDSHRWAKKVVGRRIQINNGEKTLNFYL